MNLIEHLQQQARARPEAVAIIDRHRGRRRATTFAQIEQQRAQAAALLYAHGLRRGDAVLLLQPMSAELYVLLAAVFAQGLVAVVLDPSAGRRHVAACCAVHPIRGFVGSRRAHLLRLLVPGVRRIPKRFSLGGWVPGAVRWERAATLAPRADLAACDADTPALLTFTSGSTGAPKAAIRTHGLLAAQYAAVRHALGLQPGQIDLATLPIFVLANLAAGVTTVLPDADLRRVGDIAPAPVLAQMQQENVTRVTASPAFFERLLASEDAAAGFAHTRHLFTGGAPVFPDLMRRLKNAAPAAKVVALYGSTEAEPIADVALDDWQPGDPAAMQGGAGLLAGDPVPEVDLRILPDQWGTPLGPFTEAEFDALALPPEQPGEIVVSGAHVVPGYLGGRGEAETKFVADGRRWHRTGDAGYFDAEGRLWLLGRCAAKVVDAHGICYPLAVESAAQAWPGVQRAAFLAHEGQRWLLLEPGETPPDVAAVAAALSWAKLAGVRRVDKLPVDRRHNAKIDYVALRRSIAGK